MKYFVYSEEKKLDAMSKSESDAHRREGYRIATNARAGSRATHLNDRLVVTSIRLVTK